MDRASNVKPSRTRNLVACNQRPRTLGKNLRASARAASHSRVVKLIDHPLQRLTCNFCKEVELDHRKCLQVNGWKSFLQSAKQIEVVLERQFRIQAANDMELGQRIRVFLLGEVKDLVEQHRVAALLAGFPRVSSLAQLAVNDADVGVID